ncbi:MULTISPECIES: hypothetical protein [unclassified Microcoleus]|uniref:hypothetical protein n=1 Tax=unclassified Microcoleus TaxID=2642155 RepID=UPI002FD3E65D
MIVTNSRTNNEILADTIGKLINVDEIVQRLWATDCQQCSLFTEEQVKFAFLKWIENNLESIEMQPEWFLNQEPKHFYRNLPFDALQEATDLREDEDYQAENDERYRNMYAEMDARINSGEFSQDISEYIAHRNRNQQLPSDPIKATL